MKITVQSSKLVKPAYVHSHHAGVLSGVANAVPLTVLDKANFDQYISSINFFHPPAHSNNAILEAGLARALALYREWAGRLGVDADGNRVIWLNDAGARFVEATADVDLRSVMPLEPSPELLSLHPDGESCDGELMLVQVTRFACGSVGVGHTMHHIVADGGATCNVLLAWGQATRGVPIDPVPVHDRESFFMPRCPPRVEFQHRGVEFKPRSGEKAADGGKSVHHHEDMIVVHHARFSKEFVSELKSRASTGAPRPYSTLQCLAAHLWRCITKARELDDHQVTKLRVAVDGRARMKSNPRVPDGYTGNVVLWACPTTTAHQLVNRPLQHAVELISRDVARIDDSYFRSFIDFASSGAVEAEGLRPASDVAETVLSPDVELDSLLHAPFYEMDFGDGPPFLFMPGYLSVEGSVFIVRSFAGDSSVDAYVPLLSRSVNAFKNCCYSLPPVPPPMAADARL